MGNHFDSTVPPYDTGPFSGAEAGGYNPHGSTDQQADNKKLSESEHEDVTDGPDN